MDADLSHDPADVPNLINALDAGADLAIGSRYLKWRAGNEWSENRLLLSTTAIPLCPRRYRASVDRRNQRVQAIRTSVLRPLDWKKFKTEGYGFQVELHYFLWQAGAKLVEVRSYSLNAAMVKPKMTLGIAIEAALRTLQLGLATKSSAQTSKESDHE